MGLDFPLSCPPQMAKPSPPLASIVFSLACVCLAAGAGYLFVQGRRGIAYSVVGALLVLIEWFRLRRTVSAWALVPAAFLVVFYATRVHMLNEAASAQQSPTFDIYALYVDGSFGFQPSVW